MTLRSNTFRIDEIGTKRLTADTDSSITYSATAKYGTAKRHAPIKVVGEMQVGLCASGDIPEGSLERVEADGAAVVNWTGAVPFANGNASALEAGDTDFVADGSGNLVATTGDDVGTGDTRKVWSVIGDTAWVLFG